MSFIEDVAEDNELSTKAQTLIFRKHMPNDERRMLAFNISDSQETSKLVMDGVGIDRFLSMFAEGVTVKNFCKALQINKGGFVKWMAENPDRLRKFNTLKDALLMEDAEKAISDALNETDYETPVQLGAANLRAKMGTEVRSRLTPQVDKNAGMTTVHLSFGSVVPGLNPTRPTTIIEHNPDELDDE